MIEGDSFFEIHEPKNPQEVSQEMGITKRSVGEIHRSILAIPAKTPQQFFQI
jgi:hypothetical protein